MVEMMSLHAEKCHRLASKQEASAGPYAAAADSSPSPFTPVFPSVVTCQVHLFINSSNGFMIPSMNCHSHHTWN